VPNLKRNGASRGRLSSRRSLEAQRREVLNALFERIHVRQNRKIEGYTLRTDRGYRVRLLISTAFDSIYGWPWRDHGPDAMVAKLRHGGAGV
jgi:hypothetical protein